MLASARSRKFARLAVTLLFLTVLLTMGYFLREQGRPPPSSIADGVADVDELRARLENGTTQQRLNALRQLIGLRAESTLVRCLTSSEPAAVQLAITGLWECWLDEAGPDARREMEDGVESMNAGELSAAVGTFKKLSAEHPDWAEAINKTATVLYLQGHPEESIAYCRRVVALKPDHFGAWNGMAICAIQIEDWPLALQAVQESLRLQPHSQSNRQLFQLVQSRLRQNEA